MQRRAAAAYTALFLIITVGSYGVAATATAPTIDINPDHELRQDQSVRLDGTQYTVSNVNASAPAATIEWNEGNETQSESLEEGTNVTLGGTQYTAHFEGQRLQLTSNYEAYSNELAEIDEHNELVHSLEVMATLSAIAGVVLLSVAYMPVRRD